MPDKTDPHGYYGTPRPYGPDPGEPRDYRDSVLRVPPDLTLVDELAMALGWAPLYHAPLHPPVAWAAPDGTRQATLPPVADLLAEVARLREMTEADYA